jgi:gluconolactonase
MSVEVLSPRMAELVDPGATIEWLGSGYQVAEGPVWSDAEDALIFSDIHASRRMRWRHAEGFSLVCDGTQGANGLALDPQGRLLACQHDGRRVVRMEPDGAVTVVADTYRGARLNRPNDVVVRSDGHIYFTDPILLDVDSELDLAGVYCVTPDLARIHLIVRDFVLPNGLCLSPDETTLYVNDTARRHIRAFGTAAMGQKAGGFLDLSSDRVVHTLIGDGHGRPDGMKVDVDGRIWCTGPTGVWVMTPDGERLGAIRIPEAATATNLCFGGPDRRTLFITTFDSVGRIPLKVAGARTPALAKA